MGNAVTENFVCTRIMDARTIAAEEPAPETEAALPDQGRKGPSTCEKHWYAIRDSNPEPAD
jgi:hypothetical protein